jgi:hypothetical protein
MSDNLNRWIAAYERMDERRKIECLAFAERQASAYPAKKAVRLTLVHSTDAKNFAPQSSLLGLPGGIA